jgi:transmembrane sensor
MRDEHLFIAELLEKYPDLNHEEREQFNRWLGQGNNKDFFNPILDKEILEEELRQLDELKIESEQRGSWEKLLQFRIGPQKTKTIRLNNWRLYAAAASIIMILGAGGFIWYQSKKVDNQVVQGKGNQPAIATDANPGRFKAKLVLADGSSIVLDSATNGTLVQQENMAVVSEDGKLVYKSQDAPPGQVHTAVVYNKLVTAKGETFTLVLADGSKVWLNSESSITYPVTFVGEERKVTVTGEAYFEVARAFVPQGSKSVKQTFKVVVDNMEVEVLGTHFNINAYTDEDAIKTTLLEGKVKIVSGSTSAVLKPGQQAQLKKGTTLLQVRDDADLEQAVAWKNGYFQFGDDDLKTVMRQLARWYDVEVIYQGSVSADTYSGTIDRRSKASEVLTVLERNRVHFKIEGKKIIVTR